MDRLLLRVASLSAAVAVTLLLGGQAPASAHHGGAHILRMVSVTCHTLLDHGNDEEPYLKLNGDRFWSHHDCVPETTLDLSGVTRTFWNVADLELMEDDFGFDDHVLIAHVGPEANAGVQSATSRVFTGERTVNYFTMRWEVTT